MTASSDALTFEQVQSYPRTHKFLVFAETKPGAWFLIHKGSDRSRAVTTANFWDERVPVEFIDSLQEAFVKQATEQAEVKRRESLPFSEQFALSLKDQVAVINAKAEEVLKQY